MEFDLFIVDDDIYGFLEPDRATSRTQRMRLNAQVYLTSLSKSVLPALRSIKLHLLYAPPQTLSRLSSMVRSSVWMPSPLMAQLASNLINSGKAGQLVRMQQQEAAARQHMARFLANTDPHPASPRLPYLAGAAGTVDQRRVCQPGA